MTCHSIVDVSGINKISREVFARAAGAICGMVDTVVPQGKDKPLVVASMFGNTTPAVEHAKKILEAAGYEVLVFHCTGTGYWIGLGGKREEFELEEGDVWMIPAGYEHGSEGFKDTGKNSDDFAIAVFNGTEPAGCHKPGHYYVEKEGYLPSFELKKTPTDRYTKPLNLPAKMRGIIFHEKGKASLQDEPTPGCDTGKVLCESLYTGLTNGTERNVLVGGNYGGSWPGRCGYQNVGRVLAIGMGVKDFQPGDLVFSGDFCQHTKYFAAPATEGKLLVKLPLSVDPKHAALFGVARVAMHDVRRAVHLPRRPLQPRRPAAGLPLHRRGSDQDRADNPGCGQSRQCRFNRGTPVPLRATYYRRRPGDSLHREKGLFPALAVLGIYDYAWARRLYLPIGSGPMESAIRRVINLRLKGPGIFWHEASAEAMIMIRSYYKGQRWNELAQLACTAPLEVLM